MANKPLIPLIVLRVIPEVIVWTASVALPPILEIFIKRLVVEHRDFKSLTRSQDAIQQIGSSGNDHVRMLFNQLGC
jgi:hypothetical protein